MFLMEIYTLRLYLLVYGLAPVFLKKCQYKTFTLSGLISNEDSESQEEH